MLNPNIKNRRAPAVLFGFHLRRRFLPNFQFVPGTTPYSSCKRWSINFPSPRSAYAATIIAHLHAECEDGNESSDFQASTRATTTPSGLRASSAPASPVRFLRVQLRVALLSSAHCIFLSHADECAQATEEDFKLCPLGSHFVSCTINSVLYRCPRRGIPAFRRCCIKLRSRFMSQLNPRTHRRNRKALLVQAVVRGVFFHW